MVDNPYRHGGFLGEDYVQMDTTQYMVEVTPNIQLGIRKIP